MEYDFIVIGAGMAGASIAALLASDAKVVLLEREQFPGYHSTGRSAALFSEIYGNEQIRALSRASRTVFTNPPTIFGEAPLVKRRGSLFVATAEQLPVLEHFAALPDIAPATRRLDVEEMLSLFPLLRPDFAAAGLLETGSMDIEVHELLQGYLRLLKQNGGTLETDAEVEEIAREDSIWRVKSKAGTWSAPVVVNAAGAWADAVATMAGMKPIGLRPCRRTAVLVEPPASVHVDEWPMVIDVEEQFYVKPDAGLLLVSPADETPVEPGDVQPEELDVATAIYRAEMAIDLQVKRTKRSWAGLRSFVPDRTPVVGFTPEDNGFFWLAAQGGYGIQTAPALARVAAALAQRQELPADLVAQGIRPSELAPGRLWADTEARRA